MHHEIYSFILEILRENEMDKQSLFHLVDTWESLKIDEMKRFMTQWDVKPRFAFQVFFIENISRMTLQTQNACLKFFEEPWAWNIIFLSNASESGVIDTILSRVQKRELKLGWHSQENSFYSSIFEWLIVWESLECITYFFSAKLEKNEYLIALKTLMQVLMSSGWKYIKILSKLEKDINGVEKNNLSPKYILDSYIVLLST